MKNCKDKNVLLIAGGGTLGVNTSDELLKQGARVDVICLGDKVTSSDNENIKYYNHEASIEYLESFLEGKYYDCIVNFLHYPDAEDYRPYHRLLSPHTKQLIITSSYRVYANEQVPITETAPTLYATSTNEEYLTKETYAISKAKIEDIARQDKENTNWTIIRPVISFSEYRLDIVMHTGHMVLDAARDGSVIYLPADAANMTAGLDWAGNSGKLIANLMFKEEAIGKAFTISSAPNLTWREVAELYTELTGVKFEWISIESYCEKYPMSQFFYWALLYDRLFDRKIDNSKVLKVTGLKKEDFMPMKKALELEISKAKKIWKNKSN